ncbi:flagellar protein FlaG [Tenuibacillus multivorans]|uniref:Flagellar protein FlaG n=1 Tax=Tenuibacillus multivorans TaxID=237069 RepID=A0A1H0G883_9BACI|nr:flagellar protein FlaG [Tenuibacillus multivorans]GEL78703.1 hypothetical protein TMU01_29380 [Tenuibacillus multivorans]SDO03123.1 flagellar protein FlaG [Tenuibacillus multivorans]
MKIDSILANFQLLQESGTKGRHGVEHTKTKPKLQAIQEEGASKRESGEEITKERASELVEGLNEFLEPVDTSLKYELHDKLDRYYVTVVDQNTDEVIKEIPPKKLLDVYAAMAEFMGLIVDEKI